MYISKQNALEIVKIFNTAIFKDKMNNSFKLCNSADIDLGL